ncbi:thiamine pyrophosphate-dependent dehydrogenase E1 component subunit alpha [Virgibacillus halodenitrificans]|uniref:2-oxoisovalerate dehydrogenase subunit alpha n=2 Tax=Virgibacillus halodenitrificans TaxID=1482 RepID=A0ABR7VN11_VIRHA|nr:thiamine pyrophosphate-dependent dehydrogenase E1 component subunit alpha [Virgibacillus halodenitrificans]MBD1222696.1 thiamine pyrophosphate-dependent dehydrogenase E1 component subunit alpha [Virgibacillus halodenitrificans]MCG1029864.1 thiamine pyrophosphate-dependent dehydrogenase E1 component subunit alpha [Virgibacillus halodenitrificans]MCJ0930920.1 thiamine pyrophosphate-dependent dehydrogenase E1 component subunit alpha [Virgibacillus halodenitrificans]MEC2158377.1 thiamine pyropho
MRCMSKERHEALGLSDDQVLEMFKTMLLARKLDERMWLLNRAGKIPFVISCQGQEAAQVGASFALDRDKDYVAPYYRDMGVVLAFGMTATELMLSGFAKAEDPNSGGRQMPGHFGQKKNRILTGSSPVTTQVPHAVGVALAAKMEKKDFVSFVTLGEGSSNQGDFHEGLNFAGVHKLPVITMVENNKYAISVPIEKQIASKNVSDRAQGYGMPGITVDGNDPLAVYEAVKDARERAINGEGPTLIEAVSYRLTAHSSDDDDRQYRESDEVEEAKQKDSIITFAAYLKEVGILTEEVEKELNQEIGSIVNEATDYAENAPYADPEDALKYVYEE